MPFSFSCQTRIRVVERERSLEAWHSCVPFVVRESSTPLHRIFAPRCAVHYEVLSNRQVSPGLHRTGFPKKQSDKGSSAEHGVRKTRLRATLESSDPLGGRQPRLSVLLYWARLCLERCPLLRKYIHTTRAASVPSHVPKSCMPQLGICVDASLRCSTPATSRMPVVCRVWLLKRTCTDARGVPPTVPSVPLKAQKLS